MLRCVYVAIFVVTGLMLDLITGLILMVIFGIIGVHIPILIHTLAPEARDEHQALPAAIRGESRVIAGKLQVTGTAIQGRSRATLLQVITHSEALFWVGKTIVYFGDIPVEFKG